MTRRTQFWLSVPGTARDFHVPTWDEVSGCMYAEFQHPVTERIHTHALVQLNRRMTESAIRKRLYGCKYDTVVLLPAKKQEQAVTNFLTAHPDAHGLDTIRLNRHLPTTEDSYLREFLLGTSVPPRPLGAPTVKPGETCPACRFEPCMCIYKAEAAAAARDAALIAAIDAEDAEDDEESKTPGA